MTQLCASCRNKQYVLDEEDQCTQSTLRRDDHGESVLQGRRIIRLLMINRE